MIERASEFGAAAAVPLALPDDAHLTAGSMLREAREAHGLHLEMVAAALKVTPAKLQALENDDIGALPDPVFARALAASVCRALRIDPAPVLAKLPGAQPAGLAQADRTMSKNLRTAAPRTTGSSGTGPSRTLLIVVLFLLIAAAALFWVPQSVLDRLGSVFQGAGGSETPSASERSPNPSAAAPDGTVVEPVSPGIAVPGASSAANPATGRTGPASGAGLAGMGAAPPARAEPAAALPPPAAAPAAPANQVAFTAREDSWISVTDAGGKPLLQRTVRGGESVRLSGDLPLSVVVGRAAAVDVQVRGQPFDLASLAKSGGVARFQVKP